MRSRTSCINQAQLLPLRRVFKPKASPSPKFLKGLNMNALNLGASYSGNMCLSLKNLCGVQRLDREGKEADAM